MSDLTTRNDALIALETLTKAIRAASEDGTTCPYEMEDALFDVRCYVRDLSDKWDSMAEQRAERAAEQAIEDQVSGCYWDSED